VVADDGVGFVPPSSPGGTLGLVGMAERAELIDARLRVDSAPGKGCRVTVDAPPWKGR
jgi:signal transduction histidine kinase